MRDPSKFWDKMARTYSHMPVADEDSYQKKLQVTQQYLRPDMEVLEFGCGTGSTAIVHAPHVKHIRAIDISTRMIEIARAKADANNITNIKFLMADINAFSVPDQTLDAVLGLSILHLVDDKEAVMSKVHKMLKPGGIFVTSTTCLADGTSFLKKFAPIGTVLGLMPPLKIFTEKELQNSMTETGFRIDHLWQPGKGKAVFIVAKKADYNWLPR